MQTKQRFSFQWPVIGVAVVLSLGGCGHKAEQGNPSNQPMEVGVTVLQSHAVELPRELPGRTSAFKVAEIRPQVGGIIVKRAFIEGSDIKAGELLYQINPDFYQANYEQATANLAKARANREAAQHRAKRFAELVTINAVSQQDNDDAQAAYQQSMAEVAAAKAAQETARINLAYSRVSSPISGRIGKSTVTDGALVTANQPTALATVQQLDPVYVDVTQSSRELLLLRSAMERGQLVGSADRAQVRLILEDGTEYAETGKLQFTDVTVDPSTGMLLLRAIFPNPKRQLLPGMFVRTRLIEGSQPQAILVPQKAVTRTPNGEASVFLVGPDNKVVTRKIKASRTIKDQWLVSDGVAVGDQVILDNLMKIRPGLVVKPVIVKASASAAKQE